MKNILNENKNRAALLKSLGILTVVILLFALLARVMLSGGETLADYAEKNTADTGSQQPLETDKTGDAAENEKTEAQGGQDMVENKDAVIADNPERVTYKSSFYYEPLSAELTAFITGISYPEDGAAEISLADLVYLHVLHVNFDGETAEGELICNRAIAQDLVEIFYELYLAEYQIEKITLIENYDGDDTASMADNNTSCFNYRPVDGTDHLSKHAYGLAVDINPFYNPYVRYTKDGGQLISPQGSEEYADRSKAFSYKIDTSDYCYRLFIEHGFAWGGNWNTSKDYQHFQKVLD